MQNDNNSISYLIKDFFVLLFYRVFSFIPLSVRLRNNHREQNDKAWNDYNCRYPNDKYIEHQQNMKNFLYGKRYGADYNSCEVIALYNALIALNKKIITFPELLESFESRGITCRGAYGTSPYSIINYLKKNGFSFEYIMYSQYKKIGDEFEKNNESFIFMTYNNSHSIKDMIHTMCITKENGYFQVHNDYEGSKKYPSLNAAISGYNNGKGRVIMLIGISKETNK